MKASFVFEKTKPFLKETFHFFFPILISVNVESKRVRVSLSFIDMIKASWLQNKAR